MASVNESTTNCDNRRDLMVYFEKEPEKIPDRASISC